MLLVKQGFYKTSLFLLQVLLPVKQGFYHSLILLHVKLVLTGLVILTLKTLFLLKVGRQVMNFTWSNGKILWILVAFSSIAYA